MKDKINQDVFLSLYHKGLNDTKIAKILNIHVYHVLKLRHTLNLPIMNLTQQYKDKIIEFVNIGYSDQRIAKELNISNSMVNYIRHKLKLKTNFIERNYETKEDRIKGYMIRNVKYSAKRRNLEFDLDYKDITLPKYCPLLEIELTYNNREFNNMYFPTIDRIDNSKGYIKGNVIVISRLANAMKNQATFEQLKCFSKNIIKIINFYENQGALGDITDIFYKKEELIVSVSSRCTFKNFSV